MERENGTEISGGRESGDCLAPCMQMTLCGESEEDLKVMVEILWSV